MKFGLVVLSHPVISVFGKQKQKDYFKLKASLLHVANPGRQGRQDFVLWNEPGEKRKKGFFGVFFFDDKMYKRGSIGFLEMRSLIQRMTFREKELKKNRTVSMCNSY